MGIKLIKKNGKSYIELPEVFNQLDEVELFQLKENFWLLSAPLAKAAEEKKEGKKLSDAEKAVLHKLMEIRFADRTPSKIEKTFSADEKNTVRGLIKRGFIQVFYGKKYQKTGVYNISDEIYPLINHDAGEGKAEPQNAELFVARQARSATNAKPEVQQKAVLSPTYSELVKTGWMVIPHSRDAEQFSYDLKKSGLSQNVKGVRAFDGRFYVATNKFLYSAYEKIKAVLEKKKEMHTEEVAAATGLEPEAVSTVLHILAESGEVIEKKRGLFCLA